MSRVFTLLFIFSLLLHIFSAKAQAPSYLFGDTPYSWDNEGGNLGSSSLGDSFRWDISENSDTAFYFKFSSSINNNSTAYTYWTNTNGTPLEYELNSATPVYAGYPETVFDDGGAIKIDTTLISSHYYYLKSQITSDNNCYFAFLDNGTQPARSIFETEITYIGGNYVITTTLDGNKGDSERIWARYSTDNWTTNSVVELDRATGNNQYQVSISPSSAPINLYTFTTIEVNTVYFKPLLANDTLDLSDLLTINWDNNNGKNYQILPPPGNCMNFDGTDDYISLSDESKYDFTSSFTVEAWFKVDQFDTDYQTIIAKGDDTWRIARSGTINKLSFDLDSESLGSPVSISTTSDVTDHKWHHVAAVYSSDDKTMKLYLDGIEEKSTTFSETPNTNNVDIYIGANADEANRHWNGDIDEVRIWNVARPLDSIRKYLHRELPLQSDNLVSYFNFDVGIADANNSGETELFNMEGANGVGTCYNFTLNGATSNWTSSGALWKRWENSSDIDWSKAENWQTLFSEPTINDMVLIPAVATNDPEIGETVLANCRMLKVESGASLLLKSSSSGTSSLIVDNDSDGTVTWQRWIPADRWHYFSSAIDYSGTSTKFSNADGTNLGLLDSNPNDMFYQWKEDEDNAGEVGWWIDYLRGSDGTGSRMSESIFRAGTSYAITYTSSPHTLELSGELYDSDVEVGLTLTEGGHFTGWNQVGNPFCSELAIRNSSQDYDNFLEVNGEALDDSFTAVYLWEEQNDYNGYRNDYTPISNAKSDAFSNNFIQAGQGFMVCSELDGNTLKFPRSIRKHHDGPSAPGFVKKSTLNNRMEVTIRNPNGLLNDTEIVFIPGMSRGLDKSYDAGKCKGNLELALSTKLIHDNGVDFSIQTLPPIAGEENYVVELRLEASIAGAYTFYFSPSEDYNYQTGLIDHKLNTISWIETDENLHFQWETNDNSDRFSLIFKNKTTASSDKYYAFIANKTLVIQQYTNSSSQYSLTSISGKCLLKGVISNFEKRIPLQHLASGLYLVNIRSESDTYSTKIILIQ